MQHSLLCKTSKYFVNHQNYILLLHFFRTKLLKSPLVGKVSYQSDTFLYESWLISPNHFHHIHIHIYLKRKWLRIQKFILLCWTPKLKTCSTRDTYILLFIIIISCFTFLFLLRKIVAVEW